MNLFFDMLAARLKEPSTWSGIAALGVLVGLDPNAVSAVAQAGIAIAGAAAVLLPEAPKR